MTNVCASYGLVVLWLYSFHGWLNEQLTIDWKRFYREPMNNGSDFCKCM